MDKIAIVLGTRPEIIKMAPVIRECQRLDVDFFILHTGQHYSYSMDEVFFRDLELPNADVNLEVGSGTQASQTAKILVGCEDAFLKLRPAMVMVQGDTNTVMAAALAAAKLHIKIGHIEAGLRSYDRSMPEESNRIITDHISDYLFPPTERSKKNLEREGIVNGVTVTGNTIVDAVYKAKEIAARQSDVMQRIGLRSKGYVLVTSHRQENVDDPAKLSSLLMGLKDVGDELNLPVIFSVHPRTLSHLKKFSLTVEGVNAIEPVGYLDFLRLEANASIIMTDSGGVQEEACILGVPCVTLRDNTERPETVEVGANIIAGTDPERMVIAAKNMLLKNGDWINPFGDGKASSRILDVVHSSRT